MRGKKAGGSKGPRPSGPLVWAGKRRPKSPGSVRGAKHSRTMSLLENFFFLPVSAGVAASGSVGARPLKRLRRHNRRLDRRDHVSSANLKKIFALILAALAVYVFCRK